LEKLKNSKVNIRTPLKNYRRGFARQTLSERRADVPQVAMPRGFRASRSQHRFPEPNQNAKQNKKMK